MSHPTFSPPTTPDSLVTRRTFLKSLLTTWAIASCLPWQIATADPVEAADNSPAWLSDVTGDVNATLRLGNAYLGLYPEEQDPDHLISLIDEALVHLPQFDPAQLKHPDQIAITLKRLVRSDYVNDDIVSLEGWVLSQTEARLYALVAALHNP